MPVSPDTESAAASIDLHARLKPEFPALVEPGGSIFTYEQLWHAVERLGEHLRGAGVRQDQVVVVLVPQGALYVVTVAGVMRHCCCAPLNPNLTATEIEAHLRAMHAAAIVLTPEFEEARQIALRLGITVLRGDERTTATVWQVERPAGDKAAPTKTSEWVLEMPGDTSVLLNTSATTGQSKLVPLTHANIEAMCAFTCKALALTAADRLLLVTPLYHAQGIVSSFAQFLAGGTILATRGFEAASYPGWLDELRPTWYTCAPALHQAIATLMEHRPLKKPVSLRFVRSSGAAFTVELARDLGRLLGVPVLNGYGMSETGAVTSDALNLRPYRAGSVGRSVGPAIGIMHGSGALLPPGEEGEIVVRGPSVMGGYANNPEANRAAFRDGWFRTGDLGHLDADGLLFITGRSKEMINRGGQKIVPEEVDRVLEAHPAVREAVAFGVSHPTLGEDIACAVVPHADVPINEAELRRFAGRELTSFKVPRRIYFVEEIPRGETGKPKRHLLAERVTRKPDPSLLAALKPAHLNEHALPDPDSSPVVRRLMEIWARVLKRDEVDLAEDFFTAGGDSLGAVNLLAEIDLRFGSNVQSEAASFLDNPTLAQAAKLLSTSAYTAPPASSEIDVFPVGGSVDAESQSPIFCIPGDGDEGLYFRRLARYLEGRLPLAVVRPVNTWHEGSLFTIEHAAEGTVRAIQHVQPSGLYLLGGYCYGGIVAFAAARLLRRQGHTVRLVLFDVPAPGYPSPWSGPGAFAARAASEWRHARLGDGIAKPAVNLRRLVRRGMWLSILPVRGILRRLGPSVVESSGVRWLIRQAQKGYLPLYGLRHLDVPMLHFLSLDERRPIRGRSRLGWRRVARSGITEHWVPFDHDRHFRESNLGFLSDTIVAWCGCPPATLIEPEEAEAAQLLHS